MFEKQENIKPRIVRRQFIWMWAVCLLAFATVAWLRFHVVPHGMLFGEQVPPGPLSLSDPVPAIGGYCQVRLGTFFRLMHNLTAGPCLSAYMLMLVLVQYHWSKRAAQGRPSPLLSEGIAVAAMVFTLVYMLSILTPVRVFGVRLAMT